MNQTKLESLLESFINIGSGFIVAFCLWVFVVRPVWDIEVDMLDNFVITVMFTIVSIIRSYLWRRFFNAGLHKWTHNFVRRLF